MYFCFKRFISFKIKGLSYYHCFDWERSAFNRLHIFNKETNEMIHIQTNEQFFFFHVINSFEQEGVINIDIAGYKDKSIIDDLYLANLKYDKISPQNKANFMRLKVNPKTKEYFLESRGIYVELPNINDNNRGLSYQFVYGISASHEYSGLADFIIKCDVINDKTLSWKEKNLLPGEPVFISSNELSPEDSGILMTICFDTEKSASCIVILNAENMKEISRHCRHS